MRRVTGLGIVAISSGTCGGEDSYGYDEGTWGEQSPDTEGVDGCKALCAADSTCNAIVWRHSDKGCFWKSGVTADSLYELEGHDCYRMVTEANCEPTPVSPCAVTESADSAHSYFLKSGGTENMVILTVNDLAVLFPPPSIYSVVSKNNVFFFKRYIL